MMSGTTTTPRDGEPSAGWAISTGVPDGNVVRTAPVLLHLGGDQIRAVGMLDLTAAGIDRLGDRVMERGPPVVGQETMVGMRREQRDIGGGRVALDPWDVAHDAG